MAKNVRVEETHDYNDFVSLAGNRKLDERHVKRLVKKMTEEGNLTQVFPIIVNEKMEVIDGQHRLEALRRLEWPVFYEVKKGLTIETVEALNTGVKNWTWFDYAFSFAERGNENYQKFLNLWDFFNLPYSTIIYFTGSKDKSTTTKNRFHRGEFVLENHTKTFQQLKQLKEASEAADGHMNSKFAQAMYQLMQSPAYEQKRMVDKLFKHGGELRHYGDKTDYMRALEDIYNKYSKDTVRLF